MARYAVTWTYSDSVTLFYEVVEMTPEQASALTRLLTGLAGYIDDVSVDLEQVVATPFKEFCGDLKDNAVISTAAEVLGESLELDP